MKGRRVLVCVDFNIPLEARDGPMGVFEIKECANGTFAIAEAIADNTEATRIIGGGNSVNAVRKTGVADRVTFISTGGGASLELLEGKESSGVAALSDSCFFAPLNR